MLCYCYNMTQRKGERKAVLNVTVSQSLADDVRHAAKLGNTTISSVVERALTEQIGWEIRRREGLAAIEAYYKKHGHPDAETVARAEAQVREEERLIDEALATMAAEGYQVPPWLYGWDDDTGEEAVA